MEQEVLNMQQAARYMECAINTFKAHVLKKVPHQKVGRTYKFLKTDLEAYTQGRKPWKDSTNTVKANTGSSIKLSPDNAFEEALKRRTKLRQKGALGNG